MLTLGIFLAVTVGALVTMQVGSAANRRDRGLVRRRLAQEFDTARQPLPGDPALYKNINDLAGDSWLDSKPPSDVRPTAAPPKVGRWQRFETFVRQSGLSVTPTQVAVGSLAATLLLATFGGLVFGRVGVAGGVAAGLGGPYLAVAAARKKRRERLITQLATAFDQMSRVLRAGQSVTEALRAAVETSGQPLAGEFGPCLHQIEMGIRPDDAFGRLGRGTSVLELRLFVIAMNIQRQTGGNLAEVLDRLSSLTRNRVRLRQKINALTAEGRLQSVTLVVLPPLTFVVMFILNRPYAEQLLQRGQLLAATAGLMAVGVLWTRKIVNFEG